MVIVKTRQGKNDVKKMALAEAEVDATDNGIANETTTSAVLHRDLRHKFLPVAKAEGSYLILDNGRKVFDSSGGSGKIFDGSGGAAVVSIGHGDPRVVEAAMKQMSEFAYCATMFYTSTVCEQLCRLLVDSTDGRMACAYIVSSGLSSNSWI